MPELTPDLIPSPPTPDAAPHAEVPTHHVPRGLSERFARALTKLLRWGADTFFAKRYGHRAIVLETIAAVPGMVGAEKADRDRELRAGDSQRVGVVGRGLLTNGHSLQCTLPSLSLLFINRSHGAPRRGR